jgi:AraC-like DNA-binding protein
MMPLAASTASELHHRKPHGRKILAAAASGVGDFIRRLGADAQLVFSDAGVEEERLGKPNLALDLGAYVHMMESASRRTENDNFGLNFGQQFKPEDLGLIGGIALASPTLGAAVANLAELFPYHQQVTQTRLTREAQRWRLEYRILDGCIVERRQDAELTLGMFVNIFRHCLGSRWAPIAVYCEHIKPRNWREHERVFGAPVHFGQHTNAIVFSSQELSRCMPHADLIRCHDLRSELIRVAGNVGSVSFLDALKSEIRSYLPTQDLNVASIARIMGFPRWTFQRRLGECGVSFTELVESVRRELADLYIRQPYVVVTDVAMVLGYSELSALSRAFRRWYGMSPQQLREGLRS